MKLWIAKFINKKLDKYWNYLPIKIQNWVQNTIWNSYNE